MGKHAVLARSARGRDEGGFTLIELLVVIAIIPFGISLLIPVMMGFRDSGTYNPSREGLDRARIDVDSHWTIAGRLPAGTGIAAGSSVDLSLGLSNLPDPFTQSYPIEIPPCPGDPCPLFAEGEFDRTLDLDVASFVEGEPIQVLMEAALDLHPSTAVGIAAADDVALASAVIDEFSLSWTGEARLTLLYNVPAPGTLALFAVGLVALGHVMRRARHRWRPGQA